MDIEEQTLGEDGVIISDIRNGLAAGKILIERQVGRVKVIPSTGPRQNCGINIAD